MNIFYLDPDPIHCAIFHGNKHVVKMILEYAQLLCTAHHLGDSVLCDDERAVLYKCTHQNHPCAVWVRGSKSHYDWLYQLFVALCDEYTHRYGKVHLTDQKLRHILINCPISADTPFVAPPQVMPDEYQGDDTVSAYRAYYRCGKADILAYTGRPSPDWL
ncbi:pyrimidine dimer DNA glycosylase/endonuclease V [Moraxella caprae]|nr:pyrimidine dimer DNA glycosylase/endonuclease V [Moraxella caprae]